jgi:hypothetical protein
MSNPSQIQPTKSRIRSCTINGVDFRNHINQARIYETISKPYLTANLTIIDNNNLIDNMQIKGTPVSISFDAGDGLVYDAELYVLKHHGEKSSQSLRSTIYTIDCIGEEYFQDKKALVQQSFKHITGTQAIQKLHSEFIGSSALRILAQSIGPLSLQPYTISSVKPFTAISDIRKRLLYPQYPTGLTLYYRDRDSHVLGPLEALFDQLSAQQTFYQEATWGKNWFDVVRAQNAIINAASLSDENDEAGRGSLKDIADKQYQEKKVFDWRTKSLKINKKANKINPGKLVGALEDFSSLLQGLPGGHGGKPNYMTMDGSHLPVQQDHSQKTEEEQLYRALIKNGPRINVEVPCQSGFQCTVGKGVYLNLLPPIGDVDDIGPNLVSGLYLVSDLVHVLASDDRQMTGKTIMTCARGGLGV